MEMKATMTALHPGKKETGAKKKQRNNHPTFGPARFRSNAMTECRLLRFSSETQYLVTGLITS